ncbi:MAG: N utilization substance protein A [Candidatus Midichloriaceae bacterium]|jgi:N utilization substance protein A
MKYKAFGGSEILYVADSVAREKGLNKENVLGALEEAIAFAAKRKYGTHIEIKASINRQTGDMKLYKKLLVAEKLSKEQIDEGMDETEIINLEDALEISPDAKEGDIIRDFLPPLDLGRLNALSTRQIIVKKIKELERDKLYEEYKGKIGEIINGVVERVEANALIIKIGGTEAILKKEQTLKTDFYKLGDRIRAILTKFDKESKGPLLILSRTHKDFVAQLFKQEVPEIYDKIIEIKNIARDPGSKTKIAVYSSDFSIDPVGSCVGIRGARVQSIIKELRGERIDIVKWSDDVATYIVNSMGTINVSKVVIDEDTRKIEVVIPDEDQSQAIGRKGQNVKLISELVGWKIDMITEESETLKRQETFSKTTKIFMEQLNLEEILAQLLSSEGYNSIETLANTEITKLASIEGLDEEIANELISRAQKFLANPDEDKKDDDIEV